MLSIDFTGGKYSLRLYGNYNTLGTYFGACLVGTWPILEIGGESQLWHNPTVISVAGQWEYALRIMALVATAAVYSEGQMTPIDRVMPVGLLSDLACNAWVYVGLSCGDILKGCYDLRQHYPMKMRKQILANIHRDFFGLLRSLTEWTIKTFKSESKNIVLKCSTQNVSIHVDQTINDIE